jgi:hypothetical protein
MRFLGTTLALALAVTAISAAPSSARADGGSRRVAQAGAAPGSKGGASSVKSLIDRAEEMFDDQRYEESIQTLSGALVRPGATRAERIEVYRLLAFNHIALSHNDEADASVRALLALDDTYVLGSNVSPRFRDFFAKAKKAWEDEGKPGKEEAGTPTASEKPISIKHSPQAQVEAGTLVKVEGTIDDPDAHVAKVELFYRSGAKGKFIEKALVYSMGAFRGQIPPASVSPPLVEYYVLASDAKGLPVASRGDVDAPLRIAVPEEGTSVIESPWFWIPVGVVVVGGAVLTGVLVTQLGGDTQSTVHINVTE